MTRSRVAWRLPLVALAIAGMVAGAPSPQPVLAHGPGHSPTIHLMPPLPPLPTGPLPQIEIPKPEGSSGIASLTPAATVVSPTIDAKVLVLSADGNEADLPAIRQALEYIGTPYTVVTLTQQAGWMTTTNLYSGSHAYWQGVILTSGDLIHGSAFTLTTSEWQTLASFEAMFGIRRVVWYTWPTATYGFTGTASSFDPGASGLGTRLTALGQTTFGYLNPSAVLTITNAWTYLPTGVTTGTTPILVDNANHPLGVIQTTADGRQIMAFTMDSNQYLLHTLSLSFGIVNWVTKGLFLGHRHVYVTAQLDDLFIEDDIWDPRVLTNTTTYRMTGHDLQKTDEWQKAKQQQTTSRYLRLQYPFNGYGTEGGAYPDKTLVNQVKRLQKSFAWINHTYDHANLDSPMTFDDIDWEIADNFKVAKAMKFTYFSQRNLVTPDVSGLKWPAALDAMVANNVRYVVSDISRKVVIDGRLYDESNPSPQVGIVNWFNSAIYMIPRYPTNLFYNVSTPAEWVSEFNYFYSKELATSYCNNGGIYPCAFDKNQTYDQILDFESNVLLGYMLRGNIDPWMFHQPNTRAYDGTHTLLGDLFDRLFAKYSALFVVPFLSPTQDEIGVRMEDRGRYNAAGVQATYMPGGVISVTAKSLATFPITGLNTPGAEVYGGQYITWVTLQPGQTLTYSLAGSVGVGSAASADAVSGAGAADKLDPTVYIEPTNYNPGDRLLYYVVDVPAVRTGW